MPAAVAWIETRTDYRWRGEPLPTVRIIPRAEVGKRADERLGAGNLGIGTGQRPYAIFDSSKNEILISEEMDETHRRAAEINAYANWLQVNAGETCLGARVFEAHRLHAEYLRQYRIVHDWNWDNLRRGLDSCSEGGS